MGRKCLPLFQTASALQSKGGVPWVWNRSTFDVRFVNDSGSWPTSVEVESSTAIRWYEKLSRPLTPLIYKQKIKALCRPLNGDDREPTSIDRTGLRPFQSQAGEYHRTAHQTRPRMKFRPRSGPFLMHKLFGLERGCPSRITRPHPTLYPPRLPNNRLRRIDVRRTTCKVRRVRLP